MGTDDRKLTSLQFLKKTCINCVYNLGADTIISGPGYSFPLSLFYNASKYGKELPENNQIKYIIFIM